MPRIETSTAKIIRRLSQDGWTFDRHGGAHDVWRHAGRKLSIAIPRHRTLSPGVARNIAKTAGWL